MATRRRLALLATLALAVGCSKPVAPPPVQEAAPAAPPAASTGNATVVGHGPRPNPGAQIVVVLEPTTSRSFPPQTDVPVMDQVSLTFGPELLLVRTGQPVEFRNSDDTLHNVHVTHEETREPAFNVAIPTGNAYRYTFGKDGFYRVGCDIHPAMAASVFAVATPYTTLAEPDGRFTIADVAPGAYTATLYAAGKKLQRAVEVTSGVVEFTIE
jgi:plastocyanin